MLRKIIKYNLLFIGAVAPAIGLFQLMLFYKGEFLTPELQESMSWGYDPNIAIPILISGQIAAGLYCIITYIKVTSNGKEDNSHS